MAAAELKQTVITQREMYAARELQRAEAKVRDSLRTRIRAGWTIEPGALALDVEALKTDFPPMVIEAS